MKFLTLGDHGEHIYMFYFENQKGLAIFTYENKPLTFSKPTPEALPVVLNPKLSKGQVRTMLHPVWPHLAPFGPIWSCLLPLGPILPNLSQFVPICPAWLRLATFLYQFQGTLRYQFAKVHEVILPSPAPSPA